MPFSQEDVIRRWPYLYHLIARQNLAHLRECGTLFCANHFLPLEWQRRKRAEHVYCTHEGSRIAVRDQKPLFPKNFGYTDDATFEDILDLLNGRVFFWPGTETGPNKYGQNHFQRYAEEGPVVLRVSTAAMLRENPHAEYCKYNSGAPRCSGGRPSPRGADTFLPADTCAFRAGKIVEVTFGRQAVLPRETELGESGASGWKKLHLPAT